MDQLDALSMRIAQDTVPVMVAGGFQTGYKPVDIVHEDEYQRRRDQSKVANEIATNAWKLLDDLARVVREKVPQALDKPL
ncbi:hypothetical protein [Gymnodinialimonas sp. 57CJ19]|uniref:hypothetical protein n=1 Tax=Gymnodinialimonas sp. 57CJ19 TaxID=3138498 RepID=UPI003134553A